MRAAQTVFVLILFFLTAAKSGFTQSDGSKAVVTEENLFQPAIGVTWNYSPNSFRAWGKIENAHQSQILLSYRHSKFNPGKFSVYFISEIVAASWIRYPINGKNGLRDNGFGLGFTPFGFELPLSNKPNGFFLHGSAGFIVFSQRLPSPLGSRFNYTLDAGIGYQFSVGEKRALQIGYKLKHLSNGNTGEVNPGIDSHNIFVGLLFAL